MATEVLLKVENAQGVALVHVEELAKSGIGLDHLLLHQTLLRSILADTGGDFRTRDERTLGQAEEGRESIRDLGRDGKDRGLLLSGSRAISRRCASATTTLGGLLQLTRDLLLQLLHVGMDGVDRSASSVNGLHEGGELRSDIDVLLSSDRSRSRPDSRPRIGICARRSSPRTTSTRSSGPAPRCSKFSRAWIASRRPTQRCSSRGRAGPARSSSLVLSTKTALVYQGLS